MRGKKTGDSDMKFAVAAGKRKWIYPTPQGAAQEKSQSSSQNAHQGNASDEILSGWAVGILEEGAGWYQVITHYGYQGYVSGEKLLLVSAEELTERDHKGEMCIVDRGAADLLSEPGVRAKILKTLPKGSFVRRMGEETDGYGRAELADGSRGYLPLVSLRRRRDDDEFLYRGGAAGDFRKQREKQKEWMRREADLRERLTANARSWIGTQYRWGGKSGEGIDCSGLVFMSYLFEGILIYRDAVLREEYPVKRIHPKEAKKGDLLYFPGHVAMYLGNGKYLHSTGNERSFGCVINSLRREDADYRQDLAAKLLGAGSIFASKENWGLSSLRKI